MLSTSKNVLFPGHNHLLTTGADEPSLAGAWAIIKVSNHQLLLPSFLPSIPPPLSLSLSLSPSLPFISPLSPYITIPLSNHLYTMFEAIHSIPSQCTSS